MFHACETTEEWEQVIGAASWSQMAGCFGYFAYKLGCPPAQ